MILIPPPFNPLPPGEGEIERAYPGIRESSPREAPSRRYINLMKDIFKGLREQARNLEKTRREKERATRESELADKLEDANRRVAEFLGVTAEEVESCCGSICPNCDMFLDKAIALVELGYPPHLFMNPVQTEMFEDALRIYRDDPKDYQARKKELMDRMRRPG